MAAVSEEAKAKKLKRTREYLRKKYQTDPEYRERENERKRKLYQIDPEYRDSHNNRRKERKRKLYQTNPEYYRERENERKKLKRRAKRFAEHLEYILPILLAEDFDLTNDVNHDS